LSESIVCDLTVPFGPGALHEGMLQRWKDSGFDFVSLTVAADSTFIDGTIQTIAAVRAEIDKRAELLFIRSVDDIERAKREGKLGVSLAFQGTNAFQGKVEMVQIYWKVPNPPSAAASGFASDD
jgi:membrane dipeptidase